MKVIIYFEKKMKYFSIIKISIIYIAEIISMGKSYPLKHGNWVIVFVYKKFSEVNNDILKDIKDFNLKECKIK